MIDIQLPCIMWKSTRIPNTYDIGWLITSVFPFILCCGNTSDKETCREYADSLIRERGARYIAIYDAEIVELNKNSIGGVISITDTMLHNILFGDHTTVLYNYPISVRNDNGQIQS